MKQYSDYLDIVAFTESYPMIVQAKVHMYSLVFIFIARWRANKKGFGR